jgi:hypothetical protein
MYHFFVRKAFFEKYVIKNGICRARNAAQLRFTDKNKHEIRAISLITENLSQLKESSRSGDEIYGCAEHHFVQRLHRTVMETTTKSTNNPRTIAYYGK